MGGAYAFPEPERVFLFPVDRPPSMEVQTLTADLWPLFQSSDGKILDEHTTIIPTTFIVNFSYNVVCNKNTFHTTPVQLAAVLKKFA